MDKKIKILDIGCGIGRWVNNLKSEIDIYHGIDFSENFVNKACVAFNNLNNVNFFLMSATDINQDVLLKKYDLIIMNGVCMYINDIPLLDLFKYINKLILRNGCIYLQESISILDDRLTLKDFYSKDLNMTYNAIYRTKDEYDKIIARYLTSFKIMQTGLLLDNETGVRKETNAQYWFLLRRSDK